MRTCAAKVQLPSECRISHSSQSTYFDAVALVQPRPQAATSDHQVSQHQSTLELVFSDRCRLEVPSGFNPATLHRILDVLEQRA